MSLSQVRLIYLNKWNEIPKKNIASKDLFKKQMNALNKIRNEAMHFENFYNTKQVNELIKSVLSYFI